MKIGVVALARDSYLPLLTAINTGYRMRSRKNQVKFYIRYDHDDFTSPIAISLLREAGVPLEGIIGPRPESLGKIINETVERALSDDCDVITGYSDDLIVASSSWDEIIRHGVEHLRIPFFAWTDIGHPGIVTCPIASAGWIRACGQFLPEWFPFWFSDTWMHEVYVIASGRPVEIVSELLLMPTEDKLLTRGMRDFEFWVEFWCETQCLRIEQGQRAGRIMGWAPVDLTNLLPKLHGRHSWDIPNILANRAAPLDGPPPVRYLRAKERAEEWLRNNASSRKESGGGMT